METNGHNKALSREAIFAASDILTEWVDVPEWSGGVYVRGLSGKDRDEFEVALLQGKGKNRDVNLNNLRSKLVARSVVDENNKRVFTLMDVDALGQKSAVALQRIFEVAQRLSGLTVEDIDELTDNLGKDRSGDSGSNSPSLSAEPLSLNSKSE